MPASGLRQEFELATRNEYTKVKCEVGIKVDGRELPNLEVLGKSLEAMIETLKTTVSESYKAIPERV